MSDADLEKSLDWFGGKKTRNVEFCCLSYATHPKHLGQSIAYARFAGITPPWTEDMQKKQPEKKIARKVGSAGHSQLTATICSFSLSPRAGFN